jgi:uncharacterized protein YneR
LSLSSFSLGVSNDDCLEIDVNEELDEIDLLISEESTDLLFFGCFSKLYPTYCLGLVELEHG